MLNVQAWIARELCNNQALLLRRQRIREQVDSLGCDEDLWLANIGAELFGKK